MDHANQFLGTERIGTLMRRYSIPCVISLLVAEALVGAVALVLVECFPRQLIGIFGAASESVY